MVEVQRLVEEGSVVKELEGSFIEETSLSEGKFQTLSSLLDNPGTILGAPCVFRFANWILSN